MDCCAAAVADEVLRVRSSSPERWVDELLRLASRGGHQDRSAPALVVYQCSSAGVSDGRNCTLLFKRTVVMCSQLLETVTFDRQYFLGKEIWVSFVKLLVIVHAYMRLQCCDCRAINSRHDLS